MARDLYPFADPDEDDRPLAAHAACDPVRAIMLAEEHADMDDDWECDDDEFEDDFEDEDKDFEEDWDDEDDFDDDDFEDEDE